LALLAHVPAPQLASPLGATFPAGFFLATGFGAAFAAAEVLADAVDEAGAGGSAAGAPVDGVVAAAALVSGLVGGAAGVAAALPVLLAPHAAAEQEACPDAADADGATSFAWTGCGWLPPHATAALTPSAPTSAAK
jgi:hypothetical protein